MIAALIDNGSLEPAAHAALRRAAAALAEQAGVPVHAVSWRHSHRIPAAALGGEPAATLLPWLRARLAGGEREFLFVPYFISAQGAIASAVRADLEAQQRAGMEFTFAFTGGLADAGQVGLPSEASAKEGDLATIVADHVRATIAERGLRRPAVVVVDHGGPVRASAALRDAVASEVRAQLGAEIGRLAAASMESPDGPDFAFNLPLLADLLAAPGFASGDVVLAPLFLSPGRHAGPAGDLAQIARTAANRAPGLRWHFAPLVGAHPLAVAALARALRPALAPCVPLPT